MFLVYYSTRGYIYERYMCRLECTHCLVYARQDIISPLNFTVSVIDYNLLPKYLINYGFLL